MTIAQQLGADHVITYGKENVAAALMKITHGRGDNLIIDGVGKSTFLEKWNAVAKLMPYRTVWHQLRNRISSNL